MNIKIFQNAFNLYQSGQVYFLSSTQRSARFLVKDVEVRVETGMTGTKFQCQCKHHKNHMLQDKLCKRIIAVIIYLYFRRGKLEKRGQI